MRSFFAVAVCAVLATGCASITRGTNEVWEVQTTPPGASVETTHGYSCDATPCAMKMPRESEFTVTITKEGYKTYTGEVTHQTSGGGGGGMAGNILLGGGIGAVIDANNGATQELVPNPLIVELEPLDAAAPAEASPAVEDVPEAVDDEPVDDLAGGPAA